MGIEIERKFLVKDITEIITASHCSYTIRQYYIDDKMRVRIKEHSDGVKEACITIKHPKEGLVREEWEFEIDADYGDHYYYNLIGKNKIGSVEKTRYLVWYDTFDDYCGLWEIDVFHKENKGLILAEFEIPGANFEFDKPSWVGKEVTEDERYYNNYLAKNPYKSWREENE